MAQLGARMIASESAGMAKGAVGKYKLIEQIGQGGMTTVYRAYDRRLQRVVALKVLLECFRHDPTVAQRFNQEAVHAAKPKNGSDFREITSDNRAADAAWSPDGRYIVLTCARDSREDGHVGLDDASDLCVIPRTGGTAVHIAEGPEQDWAPDWSWQ